MTTVANVKRALEEAACNEVIDEKSFDAFVQVANSPTALTILANRLSDRGTAGNAAAVNNLASLRLFADKLAADGADVSPLEWAIDQLSPPQLNGDV